MIARYTCQLPCRRLYLMSNGPALLAGTEPPSVEQEASLTGTLSAWDESDTPGPAKACSVWVRVCLWRVR